MILRTVIPLPHLGEIVAQSNHHTPHNTPSFLPQTHGTTARRIRNNARSLAALPPLTPITQLIEIESQQQASTIRFDNLEHQLDELRGESVRLQTQVQATETTILTEVEGKLDTMAEVQSNKLDKAINKLLQDMFTKQEAVNSYEFRQREKEKMRNDNVSKLEGKKTKKKGK